MIEKIQMIENDVKEYNSIPETSTQEVDIQGLVQEREELVSKLTKLKLAMFVVSEPIRDNILTIAELKSKIKFLKSVPTKQGLIREENYMRGSSDPVEYKTILTKKEVDSQVRNAEKKIDILQDQIDIHNHTTEIDI